MMKAIVLECPSTAEALSVSEIPRPVAQAGWVVIKIKAFGINRAEIITRNGFSPTVRLPRVIGIECVGEVVDGGGSQWQIGARVCSLMGGLGREFNGSYAEYTCVPAAQVYPVPDGIDWISLAAMPELYYTAYGSLFSALKLVSEDRLLVRGATSAVGLAAIQLAKSIGCEVWATTRKTEKITLLQQAGADRVLIDDNQLAAQISGDKVSKVLELIGAASIKDSLQCLRTEGVLCMTGILGGWILTDFEPLEALPNGVYFTAFNSTSIDSDLIDSMFRHLKQYRIRPPISHVLPLSAIGWAHHLLDNDTANGKIVMVADESLLEQ
ncbi:alcohol dehydrogenase catalytic domain-containing protein [Chelonobacter oris]|uniref:alcohol dehydrogenase catalytic domain-containing protein n=1 Tax=Chelonobacter oris TaxID=505317 RepID=UPI00244956FC|nr:zinc-binding dehydrogenase [Chelonobacter oris]